MTPDLKQLRDLVREMRGALKPFAQEGFTEMLGDNDRPIWGFNGATLNVGDFRRAIISVARADAIIGPGDGFQEVDAENERCEKALAFVGFIQRAGQRSWSSDDLRALCSQLSVRPAVVAQHLRVSPPDPHNLPFWTRISEVLRFIAEDEAQRLNEGAENE